MRWINKDKLLSSLPAPPSFLLLLYKVVRNLAYAVWNLALALWYGSWWYLTAGVYHALLGAIRTSAAASQRRGGDGLRVMTASGILLPCLAVVEAGTVVLSIHERVADIKSLIPLIVSAAFTFYKLIYAIITLARRRRDRSASDATLRYAALADASMAMLTLERTMVASLDTDGASSQFYVTMTGSLGMAVFLVIAASGVRLLLLRRQYAQKTETKEPL